MPAGPGCSARSIDGTAMDTLWRSSRRKPAVLPHSSSTARRFTATWSSGLLEDLRGVDEPAELVVRVDQAPAGHPVERAVEVVLRVRPGVDVAQPAELEVLRHQFGDRRRLGDEVRQVRPYVATSSP